ncbi:sacsin-like [Ptychodera flava]|uniref:sacsin-like n=1 Tax=Ptychodera flava TaxID=63121 RepID=UPI00396A2A1D
MEGRAGVTASSEFDPESLLTEETQFTTEPCAQAPNCPFEMDFRERLSSKSFVDTISRQIENYADTFTTDKMQHRLKKLKNIQVKCVNAIFVPHTEEKDKDKRADSVKELPVYVQEGRDKYIIYLLHVSLIQEKSVIRHIAKIICMILDLGAKRVKQEIEECLQCKPGLAVQSLSDEQRSLRSLNFAVCKSPPMGSVLAPQHLHQYPNYRFAEDEFVGYALDSGDDEPVVISAKVLQEVKFFETQSDGSNYNFKRVYEIHIGMDQPVVVPSLDLYRIDKMTDDSSTTGERGNDKSLNDTLAGISRLLEDIWSDTSFTDDQRRIAVKRLFLSWKLARNLTDENFATEVVKHLKNEVDRLNLEQQRLKRAKMENMESTSNKGSDIGTTPEYSALFSRWENDLAKYRHKLSESSTVDSLTSTDGPSIHTYQRSTIPNLSEGKRWFRQAKADFRAAANDFKVTDSQSYEWVCFKCQQAAEKALKGGLYATLGYLPQSRSHSNISLASCLYSHGLPADVMADVRALLNLKCDHLHPRYPDMYGRMQIPNDVYSEGRASAALRHTSNILRAIAWLVKEYMD